VARAVRFLVSPEAGFITGQILPVNGGFRGSATNVGARAGGTA
jgi:NAD(P)-dependent dehydrogenase (short-subunit alcohol dehydrogenase family)